MQYEIMFATDNLNPVLVLIHEEKMRRVAEKYLHTPEKFMYVGQHLNDTGEALYHAGKIFVQKIDSNTILVERTAPYSPAYLR